MMNRINDMYINILKSKFGIALISTIPFFFASRILPNELYVMTFVVIIASIATAVRFSKKECFIFAFWYTFLMFILETGFLIVGLRTSCFGMITVFYYGISILIALCVRLIVWFFAGGIIFYIANRLINILVNWTKTEKIFEALTKFLSNPVKTLLAAIIIAIAFNSFLYFSGVPIKQEPLTALKNSKLSNSIVLNDEKLLLYDAQKNKLAVYDVKNDIVNDNVPALKSPSNEYMEQYELMAFDKMLNGNIFIRGFFQKNGGKKTLHKTYYYYIYSPDENKIIFEAELPEEIASTPAVNIDDDRLLFIGADSGKKTYIYNIKNKKLTEAAETLANRSGCKSILLKDGRVFVWGGYSSDNSAEIYDVKQNKFIKKIPMGFVCNYTYRDKLYLLDDGQVVINTSKFEEKAEDGVGDHSSGIFGDGYYIPYILVFNPQDNTFKPININKNQKYKHDNSISIAVTDDGKILIVGGGLVNKKATKTMGYAEKISFYDLKSDKMKQSVGAKLDTAFSPQIYVLNNNNIMLFYDDLSEHKSDYIKIKF